MKISVEYNCKYRLKSNPNYIFTICKLCYNTKSGKLIKQILKGGSVGYVINGKFQTLSKLKNDLEKIPKIEILPF